MTFDHWSDTIWDAFRTDLGCYIMAVGEEGEIIFFNNAAARWLGLKESSTRPVSLLDVLPKSVANERAAFVRDSLTIDGPLVVDGLIRGEGLRSIIRPLPPSPQQRRAALMMFQPLNQLHDEEHTADGLPPRQIARHNDLGVLERLTPREMEVLMLIAHGLSSNEIAESLHRSRRTIDCHRASIGHKLDLDNRIDLALIAARAGLIRYRHNGERAEGDTNTFTGLVKEIMSERHVPHRRAPRRMPCETERPLHPTYAQKL